MKRIIFFLSIAFFVLSSSSLSAQVVKVSGGWTKAAMQNDQNFQGMLNEEVTGFSALIGIDYWERKYFYLSSEVGYYRDGGQQRDPIGNNDIMEATEYWNFFHLNTSFRFRIPLPGSAHIYTGAGPKLDILFGSEQFRSQLYNEHTNFKKNRFSFGGKIEGGLVQDINNIRLGLNVSYLVHTGNVGGNDFTKLERENSIVPALSVGYRFN